MNTHSPRFVTALIIAIVYVIIAIAVVREDRRSTSGGFISLHGMISALATMPVWFPLEYAGYQPNFRSNLQMASAILSCAVLVFFTAYGVLTLGSAAFSSKPPAH